MSNSVVGQRRANNAAAGRRWRGSISLRAGMIGVALGMAALTMPLDAQQSDIEVRYLEFRQGAIDEAVFTRELLRAGAQQGQVGESLRTLRQYQDQVQEPENSIKLYSEIAALAEMTGQYDVALAGYKRVIDQIAANDSRRYDTLLRVAALHFNNGEFADALSATQQVLLSASRERQTHRAYILQIRIEGYAVNFGTAIQKLEWFLEQHADTAEALLAHTTLAELYHRAGDSEGARRTQATIAAQFPRSVEAKYGEWGAPSTRAGSTGAGSAGASNAGAASATAATGGANNGREEGVQRITSLPLPALLLHSNWGGGAMTHGGEHSHAVIGAQANGAAAGRGNDEASQSSQSASATAPQSAAAFSTGNAAAQRATSGRSGNAVVTIQVGSFANRGYARSLRDRIQTLGLSATIDTIAQNGQAHHKVRVQATDATYTNILRTLAQHNMSGFIVR